MNRRSLPATGPVDPLGGSESVAVPPLEVGPGDPEATAEAAGPNSPLKIAAPPNPMTPATTMIGIRNSTQRYERGLTGAVNSWIGAVITSGVPHDWQKRREASFSVRQAGQMMPGGPAGAMSSSGGFTVSISVRSALRRSHGESTGPVAFGAATASMIGIGGGSGSA